MLSPGSDVGRYRVEELAGTGGMGAVYRATDTVLQRPVALKVMLAERADDSCDRDRLRSESVHAARLNHPHVVPVYDAGEVDGTSYVAMQWVEGETLEELVAREGALAPATAVGLVEQIASALDHAHEQGIVHRDVKPDNVMVDELGSAYLMDFGLGKRIDSGAVTATGEFLGTADYVAPEQVEGRAVDARADVYGLGALAFRLVTGRVPFEREGAVPRLVAHVSEPPPSAHEVRPEVPVGVGQAIAWAMAKDPDDRPASAGDLARALRAALGQQTAVDAPVAAIAPVAAGSARSSLRRRLAVGAAAAVLAGSGGLSLAMLAGGDDLPVSPPAAAEADDSATTRERPAGDGTPRTRVERASLPAATNDERARERRKKRREQKRDRREDERSGGGTTDSHAVTGQAAPAPVSTPARVGASEPAPATGSPAPQPAPAEPQGTTAEPAPETTETSSEGASGTDTTTDGTTTTETTQTTTDDGATADGG